MPHKMLCPICKEMKYLHPHEVGGYISYICRDCDRPLIVRFISPEEDFDELDEENEEK